MCNLDPVSDTLWINFAREKLDDVLGIERTSSTEIKIELVHETDATKNHTQVHQLSTALAQKVFLFGVVKDEPL